MMKYSRKFDKIFTWKIPVVFILILVNIVPREIDSKQDTCIWFTADDVTGSIALIFAKYAYGFVVWCFFL